MASLTYTATDEYGNDITVRLPDWTGHLLLATTDEPPEGTLVADGSAVSRAVYHELFEKIGTRYGAGDGVSTFALPDWRDEFPRFSGSARAVGTKQNDAIRNITGRLGGNDSYIFRPTISAEEEVYTGGVFSVLRPGSTGAWVPQIRDAGDADLGNYAAAIMDISTQVPTADENRPRNVAVLPCIIYV